MDKEYESLKNNETLDHVSIPPERRDKSKFIHGKLEEKIYMENPKGYIDSLLTCKLRNPLYVILQGLGEWNPNFISSILSNRFKTCKSSNISSHICHQIGRRWRGSHALYQGTSAQKDHRNALLLHRDAYCRMFSLVFYSGRNFLLV